MRIEQLLYVVEVADSKLVNAAANKLFVTPQNISKAIRQLENELGTTIFNRTKYGMFLTESGQIVYEAAKSVLGTIKDLETRFENAPAPNDSDEIEGDLNILAANAMTLSLHNLIKRMRKNHPLVNVRLLEDESTHLMKMVDIGDSIANEADMMLFSVAKAQYDQLDKYKEKYDVFYLNEERTCLLASSNSPLATEKRISLKKVVTLPIVGMVSSVPEEIAANPFVLQAVKEYGISLNFVFMCNSYISWFDHISAGLAYGLVGSDFIKEYADDLGGKVSSVVSIPLKEKISSVNIMLIPNRKPHTAQVEKLLDLIFERYSQSMYRI